MADKFGHIFVVDDERDRDDDEEEEVGGEVFDQVKRVSLDRKNELENGLPEDHGRDQQRQQASLLQNVSVGLAVFGWNGKINFFLIT